MRTYNLYLKLFHGRKDPSQNMNDWGSDGPIFGPLNFVHTVYASHIYLRTHRSESHELWMHDDMIFYDGIYYGDWSVFTEVIFKNEDSSRLQVFDPVKSPLPTKGTMIKTSQTESPVKIIVTIKGGVCQEVKTNLPDGCWEYALVDYDNEPDLPDNYHPYNSSEMEIVPIIPQANQLLQAAQSVIANWESSDLAQTVRELNLIVTEIENK